MLNVLLACEESQETTKALRELGYRAFSCDLQECSGGHPEWHVHGDVLPLLDGNCTFTTMDGKEHKQVGKWDLLICHPPCTHLAMSGASHFEKKREDGRQREGLELFCKFLVADCDFIAVENPVNIVGAEYVRTYFPDLCEKYGLPLKPNQKVHPWMFGDHYQKVLVFG